MEPVIRKQVVLEKPEGHPWPSQDLHSGVNAGHQEAAAPGPGNGGVKASVHPNKAVDSPDSCKELQMVPSSCQVLHNQCCIGQPELGTLEWWISGLMLNPLFC